MAQLKATNINDNNFLKLPIGSSNERPTSPQEGQIRYNSDFNQPEFFDGSTWKLLQDTGVKATGGDTFNIWLNGQSYKVHVFTTVGTSDFTVSKPGEVEYLIVAGGGSGSGGGGGAGGVISGFTSVSAQTYSIEVGAGGSFQEPNRSNGENGRDSSAFGLTAVGGGGGGQWGGSGSSGGSGGGGGQRSSSSGGSGTANQGNDGGFSSGNGIECPAGGGGGAGGPGGDAPCNGIPGNGGPGIMSNILGITKYYAGGGGGGGREVGSQNRSKGGIGGGGAGHWWHNDAENGSDDSGGGGGGGGYSDGDQNRFGSRYGIGGDGGSGVVIIRYKDYNTS